MIKHRHPVGLLWPLPELYLRDAVRLSKTTRKVALGTRALAVLEELVTLTDSHPLGLPVYLVATDRNSDERPLQIVWHATFLDAVKPSNGGHPEGMRFRPAATLHTPMPGDTHWNSFVHLCSFETMAAGVSTPITELREWAHSQCFHESFVPSRPHVVYAL